MPVYHHPSFPPSSPPSTQPDFYTRSGCTIRRELLRHYLYSFIFVWPHVDSRIAIPFWMYPNTLDNDVLSGYAWIDSRWQPLNIHYRHICSFY